MNPTTLDPDDASARKSSHLADVIASATDEQTAKKDLKSVEAVSDFRLSSDALNFHRVEWRLREEWGEVDATLMERLKARLCRRRGYEPEEFEAAIIATRKRPRLPFGWTAMDLAQRRSQTLPIRLLDGSLEASRYAKGIIGLAIHLQKIQGDEPILLPVEQVREILKAKKVVVAGTITKLVEMGLLEMTKETYNTGSAREFLFKGIKGKDYVFV